MEYKGNLLPKEVIETIKPSMVGAKTARMARYWCFRFQSEAVEKKKATGAPKGFKKYVESLPGFTSWKNFAKTWDLKGENPFEIYVRLESVWDQWDAVVKRVSIPLGASEAEVKARMDLLAEDYERREMGK